MNSSHKLQIIDLILDDLRQAYQGAMHAADQAHSAATDDQSVAETQYDTLAIEAAYLAHGQSQRHDLIVPDRCQRIRTAPAARLLLL